MGDPVAMMGRFARAERHPYSHGSMTEGVESAVHRRRRSLRRRRRLRLKLPLRVRSPRDGARGKGRKRANVWIEMGYSIVPFGENWRPRRYPMMPIRIPYCEATRSRVQIPCCLETRNEGHVCHYTLFARTVLWRTESISVRLFCNKTERHVCDDP